MKAQLIVETLKVLISLGCPGFEDLKKDITYSSWVGKTSDAPLELMVGGGCQDCTGPFIGGGMVSGAYLTGKELSGGGGGGITQVLVKTKEGYEPLEYVCKREKEKLRKLLWGKKK